MMGMIMMLEKNDEHINRQHRNEDLGSQFGKIKKNVYIGLPRQLY